MRQSVCPDDDDDDEAHHLDVVRGQSKEALLSSRAFICIHAPSRA